MLFSKDEKIEKLEQRLDRLERKVDAKFRQIEASFKLFRDIVMKLQSEKEELKSNSKKEAIRKINISDSNLYALVKPIRNEVKANTELIRKLAKDIAKGE